MTQPSRLSFILLMLLLSLCVLLPIHSAFATYGSKLCRTEGFHCLKVRRNQSWTSLFPDEHDRAIVMRVNRLNIQVWSGMTLAVPDNLQQSDIMDFSPFPEAIEPPGEKIIVVDPNEQAWGAYDPDGALIRWGPASAGSDYCRDIERPCHTHPGYFRIYSVGSSDCYSTKFPLPDGGAPMPYCMYFNSGQALHGEPNGLPGYNASHGCVRLYVNDAEWLRYEFVDPPDVSNDYRGTEVIVKDY